jgi:desulfoferrodoxin (superoxide reductase-like protein)
MKKITVFIVLLAYLFVCSVSYATPPARIDAKFDSEKKKLEAIVQHPVNDNNTHYVNRIVVRLNGKQIIEQKFTRQDVRRNQTVQYLISDARGMDTLTIEAYCNMSGKNTKRIKAS